MKTVAVSGYFDPLHRGHIEYMKSAKDLGDRLVVVINNENQCILKKGMMFMPMEDKISVIKELGFVDDVVVSIDNDLTQNETIKKLKPDLWANGGDVNMDNVREIDICDKLNITMVFGLGKKVQSSSEITKKWKKKN